MLPQPVLQLLLAHGRDFGRQRNGIGLLPGKKRQGFKEVIQDEVLEVLIVAHGFISLMRQLQKLHGSMIWQHGVSAAETAAAIPAQPPSTATA
uniref:Uncharacterized protein n=1 Tax=Candidatus Kentrum sp. DK TaxID=2126562 RepID=A0A450TP04_9GAMM|nr:MAG: hypothetical protein BECKDK2373B_GA0170837_12492 [Candidatus Kentron sp. DK]